MFILSNLLICLLVITFAVESSLAGTTAAPGIKWDALKLRWDPRPGKGFTDHPRTVKDATAQGWTQIESGDCFQSKYYLGLPYAKNNDLSIVLLYDLKGIIVGIQTRISKTEGEQYCFPSKKQQPPFFLDGIKDDHWIVSVYFQQPSNICAGDRSVEELERTGTGDSLWIQSGESDFIKVPRTQAEVDAASSGWLAGWKLGKCFPTMGLHYWYNSTEELPCDAIYPVFLLYHDGFLQGFGWALAIPQASSNWEHPTYAAAKLFMNGVPDCLATVNQISTMHVYLVSDIPGLDCKNQ